MRVADTFHVSMPDVTRRDRTKGRRAHAVGIECIRVIPAHETFARHTALRERRFAVQTPIGHRSRIEPSAARRRTDRSPSSVGHDVP